MSEIRNPPAFPCETDGNPNGFQSGERLWTYPGMTLRDWFAGQALTSTDTFQLEGWSLDEIAEHFYDLADAMLRARLPAAALDALGGDQ